MEPVVTAALHSTPESMAVDQNHWAKRFVRHAWAELQDRHPRLTVAGDPVAGDARNVHGPRDDLLAFAFGAAAALWVHPQVVHGRSLPTPAHTPRGVDHDVFKGIAGGRAAAAGPTAVSLGREAHRCGAGRCHPSRKPCRDCRPRHRGGQFSGRRRRPAGRRPSSRDPSRGRIPYPGRGRPGYAGCPVIAVGGEFRAGPSAVRRRPRAGGR